MRLKILRVIYIAVLVITVLTGATLLLLEDFDLVRQINGDGYYLLHTQELNPRETPDIFIVDDGKIFVFHIEAELVNVYSVAGDYLYGIQFPHGQNGRSDMICRDGLLYVDARGSGIYVFRGQELVRFEEQHYQNEEHDELELIFTGEENREYDGYCYYYVEADNKIMRRGGARPETVVQFPERKLDAQGFMYALALWMVVGRFFWDKHGKPINRSI